jgi:hypothetical protein
MTGSDRERESFAVAGETRERGRRRTTVCSVGFFTHERELKLRRREGGINL